MKTRRTATGGNFDCDGTLSIQPKAPTTHQFPPVPWSKGAAWSTKEKHDNASSRRNDNPKQRVNKKAVGPTFSTIP